MIKFNQINEIYDATNNSNRLKHTFEDLSNLNQILRSKLPDNLIALCRVGAIDVEKSIVVIFVNNSQILHIIKSMSNTLLQSFYAANYSFNNLMVKVAIRDTPSPSKRRHLDPKLKSKLSELAIAIGKPEIIIDEVEDEIDEDEIRL